MFQVFERCYVLGLIVLPVVEDVRCHENVDHESRDLTDQCAPD